MRETGYWFRAKPHRWGWGVPTSWQGWAVMLGALISALGIVALAPRVAAYTTPALAAMTVAIAAWKGEPARRDRP